MSRRKNQELIDSFEQFYRRYYSDEIGELARNYPRNQKSLYINWNDLYTFDPDIAEDWLSMPTEYRACAEEALRMYDLSVDVSLSQSHVRLQNLAETTPIPDVRTEHIGREIEISGTVETIEAVNSEVVEAAFECQRCGTITRISQSEGDLEEPTECQGCERSGPFRLNRDQSEMIDRQ